MLAAGAFLIALGLSLSHRLNASTTHASRPTTSATPSPLGPDIRPLSDRRPRVGHPTRYPGRPTRRPLARP